MKARDPNQSPRPFDAPGLAAGRIIETSAENVGAPTAERSKSEAGKHAFLPPQSPGEREDDSEKHGTKGLSNSHADPLDSTAVKNEQDPDRAKSDGESQDDVEQFIAGHAAPLVHCMQAGLEALYETFKKPRNAPEGLPIKGKPNRRRE